MLTLECAIERFRAVTHCSGSKWTRYPASCVRENYHYLAGIKAAVSR